jgi:hypothetical protein
MVGGGAPSPLHDSRACGQHRHHDLSAPENDIHDISRYLLFEYSILDTPKRTAGRRSSLDDEPLVTKRSLTLRRVLSVRR